eukprot:45296-Amphidinium_carterae.1
MMADVTKLKRAATFEHNDRCPDVQLYKFEMGCNHHLLPVYWALWCMMIAYGFEQDDTTVSEVHIACLEMRILFLHNCNNPSQEGQLSCL